MAERWMGARPKPKSDALGGGLPGGGRRGLAPGASSRLTRTDAGTMEVRALSFCASGRLTTVLLPVMVALALAAFAAAAAAAPVGPAA